MGAVGIIAACLLYFAAKKFFVDEDPRISTIEQILPGANCGGCGLTGCHAFAEACVTATSLDHLFCTGVSVDDMKRIADIVGLAPSNHSRMVAVVKCSADCTSREPRNNYDGVRLCAIENELYQGESDCIYGCLGCGDCTRACPFGAITIGEDQHPHVDLTKCTGCGRCVAACPRKICELMPLREHTPIVYTACANRDRGALAMKECDVSCIGCGKCKKVCPYGAPSIDSNLAHIDADKCMACGECIAACPRKSIVELSIDDLQES